MNLRLQTVLGGIARVAWADGRLLPAEAALFVQVLDGLDLSAEQARDALRAILEPHSVVRDEDFDRLSPQDLQFLVDMSEAMAGADGTVSAEEQREIDRFRTRVARSRTLP